MPPVPSQIGPYRVLRQLGKGGMGVVLEAVHSTIERRVAIKLLLPEFARDAIFTERLFREALAVNRIEHPGLVQISDYGQLTDGTVYLVMEYLRGQTLAQWLDENPGPMPPQMAVKIAAQVASALAAAHAKGIVHRDLKPDNLMLVDDVALPGSVRVKVLDFGIAKLVPGQDSPKSKTATDLVMGTPYYMSPEQCQGAGFVDAKSDVYSLGVMLFKLLSGQYPFDGEGSGQLIGMHLFKPPPLLRELAPAVPVGLADLVQGLLAKSRDSRPTMEELRAEFEKMAGTETPSMAIHAVLRLREDTTKDKPRLAATTLGGSNGQSLIHGRGSLRNWMLAGVALILLLTGLVLIRGRRDGFQPASQQDQAVGQRTKPPTAFSQPLASTDANSPAPGRVKWSITSRPTGAAVISTSDGKVLGHTPWELAPGLNSGDLHVVVRHDGYLDEPLVLQPGTGLNNHLSLKQNQKSKLRAKPVLSSPPRARPKVSDSSRQGFPLEQ